MAWAIFSRDFAFDRRPAMAIAFSVKAGGPQRWPRDVVDAAVKAGAATEVKAPKRKSLTKYAKTHIYSDADGRANTQRHLTDDEH